jgi:hypothetical protein
MAWVPEYRMTPVGVVQAHCKMMGLEAGAVSGTTGVLPPKQSSYLKGFE